MAESALALYLYGRNGDALFHPWRRSLRADLGNDAHRFAKLSQQFRTVHELPSHFPDAFALGAPAVGAGAFGTEPEHAKMLSDLCRVAVLPQWSRIRGQLDGTRDNWGRVSIAHGVDRLLGSLHPKVHWHAPVLELRDRPKRDIHMHGNGLLLIPSYFLSDQTCLFLEASGPQSVHAIVFPVAASPGSDIGSEEDRNAEALGALVGHTRAAALAALAEGCFTGELADRLGISLAGASKHAAVLRRSGLVMTARNRNTALHALTPLGVALLRSSGFLPGNRPPERLGGVPAPRCRSRTPELVQADSTCSSAA